MTNEELKKKIAQIIADYFCPQGNEHKNCGGDDRLCYSKMNFAECEWVTECTDALIAAGIGDISAWKHRAEVEKMKYERRTDHRFVPATMLMCSGKCVALEIYNRLAELEDKIESGEIVDRNAYLDYLMAAKNTSELTDKEIEFFVKHNAEVRKQAVKEFAEWE